MTRRQTSVGRTIRPNTVSINPRTSTPRRTVDDPGTVTGARDVDRSRGLGLGLARSAAPVDRRDDDDADDAGERESAARETTDRQ